MSREPSRVLIFRIGQLGDTIVALPAMWVVRKHFAGHRLTLLCDRHPGKKYVLGSDLLRGSGIVDGFLTYPVSDATSFAKVSSLISLLVSLRRQRFETLVYLSPTNRTRKQIERDRRFFSLAGIRNFVGMDGFPKLVLKTPGTPLPETRRESDLLLDRLAASGLPVTPADRCNLDLGLGGAEDQAVAIWQAKLSPDGSRLWVAVAPGSKMAAKRWPVKRFEEVVSHLIRAFDLWPIVFGGSEDRAAGERLLKAWQRGYNAAGALSLRSAAAALKRCVLFLGNDTGTMHLAAAAGVRCVAIFSARDWPGRWYPCGLEHRVFRTQIECEGCGLTECVEKRNECLDRISVAQVLAACEQTLASEKQKVEIGKAEN